MDREKLCGIHVKVTTVIDTFTLSCSKKQLMLSKSLRISLFLGAAVC